jgi:hypothetical protein
MAAGADDFRNGFWQPVRLSDIDKSGFIYRYFQADVTP